MKHRVGLGVAVAASGLMLGAGAWVAAAADISVPTRGHDTVERHSARPAAARDLRAEPEAVVSGPIVPAPRPVPIGVAPVSAIADSPPITVTLPTLRVTSALETLHLDAFGVLEPPRRFDRAGWYAGGPRPGELGPAVVAGHVDSSSGPAVFFRLHQLAPGDPIEIGREDGSLVRFVVTSVAQFPKSAFPTEFVYGPTPDAQIRLITCAGEFDRTTGHYVANVVVFGRRS